MASGLSQTHPHLPAFPIAAAVASPLLLPAVIAIALWRKHYRNAGSLSGGKLKIGALLLGVVLVIFGLERQIDDSGDWFIYPVFWLCGLCLIAVALLDGSRSGSSKLGSS